MSTADQGLRDVLWHASQLADMTIKGDAPVLAEKTAQALIRLLTERTVKDCLTVDPETLDPLLRATHYVLDLETLGKGPNAAIATIGCVRIENGIIGAGLYIRVDVDSAIGFGGETDASTIEWWLRQSEEARREIYHEGDRVKINNALMQLVEFIDRPASLYGETYVWGNGATFDNVIISTAFKRAHIERPWPYWNDRDLRTMVQLYPEAKENTPFPAAGVKHHALDDAMHEARILVAALKLHIARSPA